MKALHQVYHIPAGAQGLTSYILSFQYAYGDGIDKDTRDAMSLVTPLYSYAALKVVEDREMEIGVVLSSSLLRIETGPMCEPYDWPKLDPRVNPKLSEACKPGFRSLLMHALHLCDTIHDLEAQAFINIDLPQGSYAWEVDWSSLPAEEKLVIEEMTNTPAKQRRLRIVTIPNEARRLQIKYIKALRTDDLISIFMLIFIMRESWQEFRPREPLSPTNREIQIFEENVLRNGSYFVYGEARRYGVRSKHRTEMMRECSDILDEITLNVDGNLHPALGVSLRDELLARLDVTFEKLLPRVCREAEAIIGAEVPVFARPPTEIRRMEAAALAAAQAASQAAAAQQAQADAGAAALSAAEEAVQEAIQVVAQAIAQVAAAQAVEEEETSEEVGPAEVEEVPAV